MSSRSIIHDFLVHSPPLTVEECPPKVSGRLNRSDLEDLFHGRCCAVQVPGFFHPEEASEAAGRISALYPVQNFSLPLQNGSIQKTDVEYSTIGLPKRIGMTSEALKERYYEDAVPSIRRLREIFPNGLSPTDKLRLELDELWSEGALLSHKEGKTELASVVRKMFPLEAGLAHIDDMRRTDYKRAFSACIYLQMPPEGGELELWNFDNSDRNRSNPLWRSVNTFDPETQELIRKLYPKPLLIRPLVGDLIIFDAGKPHAVAGLREGERLVIQSFIVFETGKPLKIFA